MTLKVQFRFQSPEREYNELRIENIKKLAILQWWKKQRLPELPDEYQYQCKAVAVSKEPLSAYGNPPKYPLLKVFYNLRQEDPKEQMFAVAVVGAALRVIFDHPVSEFAYLTETLLSDKRNTIVHLCYYPGMTWFFGTPVCVQLLCPWVTPGCILETYEQKHDLMFRVVCPLEA